MRTYLINKIVLGYKDAKGVPFLIARFKEIKKTHCNGIVALTSPILAAILILSPIS